MENSVDDFINLNSLKIAAQNYGQEGPFDHAIIENFFSDKFVSLLENEFPGYEDSCWHSYKNSIENKKVCNNWNVFPKETYRAFSILNSSFFIDFISTNFCKNVKLYGDPGLNGGGWHIHKNGGILNPHLDYSLHPKLNLQRKLNIIIYMSKEWNERWGGGLGLWSNTALNQPKKIEKKIIPKFNRAVIFDTTQNSWHGLPDPITCPETHSRKSLAVYYLCNPPENVDRRGKALFAPTEEQMNDKEVLDLIKDRASTDSAHKVYKNS